MCLPSLPPSFLQLQDPRPRWQQEPTDSLRSQPRKISTIPLTSPHPLPMNAPAMGEAASVGRLANALEIERDGSAPWEKVRHGHTTRGHTHAQTCARSRSRSHSHSCWHPNRSSMCVGIRTIARRRRAATRSSGASSDPTSTISRRQLRPSTCTKPRLVRSTTSVRRSSRSVTTAVC